ncbi:ABC transporter ATP-binding protein, partial [Ferruginibacter sp. HRS2-29]|uniref:ABC transporter ATP-binding protein n=1 Tax=Ferruginibacter sp. HRS2-29 TaxID=2487334 RepID=UPI0020CDD6F3
MLPLLQINNLQIEFPGKDGTAKAVHSSNFSMNPGKLTAIVGESGSGKSVTALSLLQLLPKQTMLKGEILFSEDGKQSQDLTKLSEKQIRDIRGNKIAMIFQEPMTSLNPVYTCGNQVMESLIKHKKISKASAKNQVLALFVQVALPQPAEIFNRYPHQLSGGQKQRVMIAMAMSCDPAILVADEPTTALDVRVQKNILQLIKGLQEQNNMAVLLITHDLALVADMADEVIVMYRGQIVEQGDAKEILQSPKHPYTKALLACRPGAGSKGKRLPVISDFIERDNIDKNLGGDNTGNGEKMNIADSNAYAATQDVVGDNTNNGGDKSMVKDNTGNGEKMNIADSNAYAATQDVVGDNTNNGGDKSMVKDNTGNGEKMNIADGTAYAATQDVVGDNTNNGGDKSMVKDNTNNGGLVVTSEENIFRETEKKTILSVENLTVCFPGK